MPSPFPGMDPFLEHPLIFPDFHDRFVSYLSEALQPDLPEPYYAALGRRAWVEISERFIEDEKGSGLFFGNDHGTTGELSSEKES